MRFTINQAMNAVDGSAAANSAAFDSSQWIAASAQAVVTVGASLTGAIKLQGSNDVSSPTNWSDIPNTSQAIAAAGTFLIPKTDMAYKWVRVAYTTSAHSGAIGVSANIFAIGF